ncbi:hypothetical protein GCM10027418_29500 [Mariniluteicoccus endophyticus]
MTETELWRRLRAHLGESYAGVWADQVTLRDLGSRTVREAIAAHVPCKAIWRAVCAQLELPASER